MSLLTKDVRSHAITHLTNTGRLQAALVNCTNVHYYDSLLFTSFVRRHGTGALNSPLLYCCYSFNAHSSSQQHQPNTITVCMYQYAHRAIGNRDHVSCQLLNGINFVGVAVLWWTANQWTLSPNITWVWINHCYSGHLNVKQHALSLCIPLECAWKYTEKFHEFVVVAISRFHFHV